MKKLSIGIQTFSELIENDYIYVDKTALIHELITLGKYYFLSRPRRFGKSLLVSTLAAIFSGRKELFVGLVIDTLPYEWKKHPVIVMSLSDIPYTSPEVLEDGIRHKMRNIAHDYDIAIDEKRSIGEMLQEIVIKLSKTNKVVLLIDEYDYPILQHIQEPSIAVKMREILKSFYVVIKGLDPYLEFVFLTGVSKFSKTSIFSGLNNLQDISLDGRFNELLGYTQNEIVKSFESYLTKIMHEQSYSLEQLLIEIKTWYDGYCFTSKEHFSQMYNPFSVLLFLQKSEFANYWFETGTPTFLINLLKLRNYPVVGLEGAIATEGELASFEVDDIDLKTLLFQAGYLTIKHYDQESRTYTLGYPNKECTVAFSERILKSMTQVSGGTFNIIATKLFKAFSDYNIQQIEDELTQLFSLIPYAIQLNGENYYQTVFYLVFKMLGADIVAEQTTNIGRIDIVVQTKEYCFIIEFKINSTAQKALKQIEDKKYYQLYLSLGKKIILVGIAFDTTERNVSGFAYKEL